MQGQYVVEASNDYGTYSDYFTIIVNDGKLFIPPLFFLTQIPKIKIIFLIN